MGRYEAWLKRKADATPYANEAVCRSCKYGKWVRTKAFCSGRGRTRSLKQSEWDNLRPGYCPEYIPRKEN